MALSATTNEYDEAYSRVRGLGWDMIEGVDCGRYRYTVAFSLEVVELMMVAMLYLRPRPVGTSFAAARSHC